jgi:hypothetical protein
MSQSPLVRELLRIGRAWPPDILRPRLQYGNYLVALAQSKDLEKGLTPKMVRSQQRLLDNSLKEKVSIGYRSHSVRPNCIVSILSQTRRFILRPSLTNMKSSLAC